MQNSKWILWLKTVSFLICLFRMFTYIVSFWTWVQLALYSWPSTSVVTKDPTTDWKYLRGKISEISQRQNLILLNYKYSRDGLKCTGGCGRLYADNMYAILYKGLKHLRILVSAGVLQPVPCEYQGSTLPSSWLNILNFYECNFRVSVIKFDFACFPMNSPSLFSSIELIFIILHLIWYYSFKRKATLFVEKFTRGHAHHFFNVLPQLILGYRHLSNLLYNPNLFAVFIRYNKAHTYQKV